MCDELNTLTIYDTDLSFNCSLLLLLDKQFGNLLQQNIQADCTILLKSVGLYVCLSALLDKACE